MQYATIAILRYDYTLQERPLASKSSYAIAFELFLSLREFPYIFFVVKLRLKMVLWLRAYNASRLILLIQLLLLHGHSTKADMDWAGSSPKNAKDMVAREHLNLNTNWKFLRSTTNLDNLIYDVRPDKPSKDYQVLKPWILPSANEFIRDPSQHHQRPPGSSGGNVSFVQSNFDDSQWEAVTLPHDWAIKGPFYVGDSVPVSGGMGRLPVHGVAWYRRRLSVTSQDMGKSIYLDIDGAMSYAMVWLNGNLVGGWPYGYASFRLDLTPYVSLGDDNQLAIRLDNPTSSSRWYPGGGIYRNMWLTKVNHAHVGHWGTYITTRNVSTELAVVDIVVEVENCAHSSLQIVVTTEVHVLNLGTTLIGAKVAEFPQAILEIPEGTKKPAIGSVVLKSPRLWGPPPNQSPNQYVAVTRLYDHGRARVIDTYETCFGIRSLTYDAEKGLLVNGQHVRIQGVNQHHDLGAIGAAFNVRAAERQLEMLQDLGSNAIRMSHNPPAPELLDLTDRMGFLVLDEIFDCWELRKTTSDFHLIFKDWHEPDLRSFIRRDRNHPSIYAWSFGNEVGEQSTGAPGAVLAQMLSNMVHEEDSTRPSTASMNAAQPYQPFSQAMDIISLNYQGEGIRDTPSYSQLPGVRTPPLYDKFHEAFPKKLIESSETAATFSTRGTYIFPVTGQISAPVNDSSGGNSTMMQVSAYELYTDNFGSSPDKVFAAQDQHPFVAGDFVWSGWDYLGESSPYDAARSSYYGLIDLAGFKKDRAYLYQSRWRPDLRMAHILPHWTWPARVGQVTPVHVFSAADEAELFINGKSLGRQSWKGHTYRFRWDNVTYTPGELHVVTYRRGQQWANDSIQTAGEAAQLRLTADRNTIKSDGYDLSFITCAVIDSSGYVVPQAKNNITFSLSGPAEIVATDNGDPADLIAFSSTSRKAFGGLALVIVRGIMGASGSVTVTATGDGVVDAQIALTTL
jgi:beta-galactosidase